MPSTCRCSKENGFQPFMLSKEVAGGPRSRHQLSLAATLIGLLCCTSVAGRIARLAAVASRAFLAWLAATASDWWTRLKLFACLFEFCLHFIFLHPLALTTFVLFCAVKQLFLVRPPSHFPGVCVPLLCCGDSVAVNLLHLAALVFFFLFVLSSFFVSSLSVMMFWHFSLCGEVICHFIIAGKVKRRKFAGGVVNSRFPSVQNSLTKVFKFSWSCTEHSTRVVLCC